MKAKDLRSLLYRGAAAIENPKDLTATEIEEVVEDLIAAAEALEKEGT